MKRLIKKRSNGKKMIYAEKYHDNCHDYLKRIYVEAYAMEKYKFLLYEIKTKIPKINICNDTPYDHYADTIVCDQHAVVFGHYQDIFPVLATYALNACVGLVIYVPDHKVGCLAHIDGLPGYSRQSSIDDGLDINFDPVQENMKIIIEYLKLIIFDQQQTPTITEPIIIEYYLIGGIFDLSEVMVNDIIECLNQINDHNQQFLFVFKGRNLLGPEKSIQKYMSRY